MAQTIAERNVKLHDLKTRFGLQQIEEELFFTKWFSDLPALTAEQDNRCSWKVSGLASGKEKNSSYSLSNCEKGV